MSAELPTAEERRESMNGNTVNASPRSVSLSEGRRANPPPGPRTTLEGVAAACEPGQPAYIRRPVSKTPPPPGCDPRSTLIDCSDLTSPPISAPAFPPPSASSSRPGPAKPSSKIAKISPKHELIKAAKGKGKKKEKVLVTPLEYAQKLQAQLSELAGGKKKQADKPFLKGKRIFYYGGDLNYAGPQTRNRMEIVRQGVISQDSITPC